MAAECFSSKQLLEIRFWIGLDEDPTDSDLQVLGGDLETTDPLVAARQVLGQRLGVMLNAPAQQSLAGDSQESWHQNISILRSQIKELTAKIDAATAPIVGAPVILEAGFLRRDDRDRLWDLA